jgi:retinol dehydrogenase 12
VVVLGRNPVRCEATVAELKRDTGRAAFSALVADLTLLGDTARACAEFRARHTRLDFLFLNANAIAQERIVTSEGFESNFALGHLSRALTALELEDLLAAGAGQALTALGLERARPDFDDLSFAQGYASRRALGRWQWAAQVFAGEYSARTPVPMNMYVPGLVNTKILAGEPQPMRLVVQTANLVIGITPEQAAADVAAVIADVSANKRRAGYFMRREVKPAPVMEEQPGDRSRLWDLTVELVRPFRS